MSIKISTYIVINKNGNTRTSKHQPKIKNGETAIKLNIDIPEKDFFEEITGHNLDFAKKLLGADFGKTETQSYVFLEDSPTISDEIKNLIKEAKDRYNLEIHINPKR